MSDTPIIPIPGNPTLHYHVGHQRIWSREDGQERLRTVIDARDTATDQDVTLGYASEDLSFADALKDPELAEHALAVYRGLKAIGIIQVQRRAARDQEAYEAAIAAQEKDNA